MCHGHMQSLTIERSNFKDLHDTVIEKSVSLSQSLTTAKGRDNEHIKYCRKQSYMYRTMLFI